MKERFELHGYQLQTIDKIKSIKRCALFFDMSLGKTITTLTTISDLLQNNIINKVLIIAPLRVANTVWMQESLLWQHTKWLYNHFSICTGTAKEKKIAIDSEHKILVTNRDNIIWFSDNNIHKYDMIVIDESSSFKNPSTKRFRAIRKWCFDSEYLVLLTGTPTPNNLLELWTQIFLIDKGERLGRTFSQYKANFFYNTGYKGYEYKIKYGSEELIKELIKDICVTLRASDYLTLPDKILSTKYCELDNPNRDVYNEMMKDFVVELENKDNPISAINVASKINKLLQFCNGFMYNDNHEAHQFHNIKLELLKDIVLNGNENILIAYNFLHDKYILEKEFPNAVILDKKGEAVELWNKGKIKILLAHPMSAGHGLNLQGGGSTIIWYGLTWSLECYLQFNARLHRQGQVKPVNIIHLLMKNTIDERVLSVLQNKNVSQSNFIDSLKLEIKKDIK